MAGDATSAGQYRRMRDTPGSTASEPVAIRPLLSGDDLARLREALTGAGYTSTGIADRIGPAAVDAVRRNDFRALLRATDRPRPAGHADPALPRRARPSRRSAVAAALAPLPLDAALAAGLVERYGDGLTAGGRPRVYAVQRRAGLVGPVRPRRRARPGPLRTDHVLGIGNAATTLAGATIRAAGRHRAGPRHRLRRAGAARCPDPRAAGSPPPTCPSGRCASPPPPPRSTGWTGSCSPATCSPRSPGAASTWW